MYADSHHKIGMVFGVFDGFHLGHHFFLKEALLRCDTLVVVVALAQVVQKLKKRAPIHSLEERVAAVKDFDSRLTVVPGDSELGTWQVLKDHAPEVVYLGHDQHALGEALDTIGMAHEFIGAFYPERYKSSILNRTQKTL